MWLRVSSGDPFGLVGRDSVGGEMPLVPHLSLQNREVAQAPAIVGLFDHQIQCFRFINLCQDLVDKLLFGAVAQRFSMYVARHAGDACRACPERTNVLAEINLGWPGLLTREQGNIEWGIHQSDRGSFARP